MKKAFVFLILFAVLMFCIQGGFALDTYIGINIVNLTDDPTASCAGESGYGSQGRIRALSSILPDYPLYFNLSDVNTGTTLWSGDSTDDADFEIGETIYLPQLVNLSSGTDYKIMMDVDAIRIYLPLQNHASFTATDDDNYWTIGKIGSGSWWEYSSRSVDNTCTYEFTQSNQWQLYSMFVSSNRSLLTHSCMTDITNYNCDELDILGIDTDSADSYKISGNYNSLYNSGVGNFIFLFTY